MSGFSPSTIDAAGGGVNYGSLAAASWPAIELITRREIDARALASIKPIDLDRPEDEEERALALLEHLPPRKSLVSELQVIGTALRTKPTEVDLQLRLSSWLNAIPGARRNVNSDYASALLFHTDKHRDEEGQAMGAEHFSPDVVMAAVIAHITDDTLDGIGRRIGSVPLAPADFIATCKKWRSKFHDAELTTRRLIELVDDCSYVTELLQREARERVERKAAGLPEFSDEEVPF